jgi:hypothetical protein
MPLSLHPLRERNTAPGRKKTGSEKFWKKFQNLLEIRKNDLPLHPLRIRNTVRNDKKKGSENFWKILLKRFGGFKKMTYLCTTFRWKIGGRNNGKSRKDRPGEKEKIVLYSNIFEQRSLKYLSS